MPKNIILCSDGTGNSGGKGYNTNVWRIYNAINHNPRPDLEQVAFYDDGVGSQDFKLLRALGGAFGWGISLNLCQLYGFLMLNYQPGDRIYLFGFSRGAFTIRTLGNMIRYCGVANPEGLSVHGVRKRAAEALQAYKNRGGERTVGRNADGGAELVAFKTANGIANGATKDIPIEFIGVWDTVEALGVPVDELKHGLNHWFQLQFRAGENDMHPRIKFAYHALSIDDERLTFHPTLWDEDFKTAGQTVEQVWFAGVHANVGGGYPKDQLSFVALTWMMKKAFDCGVEFHQSIWEGYQRDQDIHGELYDPRAGLGMYYRYGPRDIRRICEKYHVPVNKIHAGVFERIKAGTDAYAPTGLPQHYQVEPASAPILESEAHRADRHEQLKIVRDIAWWRRVLYYLMLLWTVALVAFCAVFQTEEKVPDFGGWDTPWRALYYMQNWFVDLVGLAVPGFAAPGLNALRHHPYVVDIFVIPFAFFFWRNWKLDGMTRDLSVRAWHMSLATHPGEQPHAPTPRNVFLDFARKLRDHGGGVLAVREKILAWVAPWITRFVVYGGLAGLVVYGAFTATGWTSLTMNPTQEKTVSLEKLRQEEKFLFDTRNSMQATPLVLEKGTYYLITAEVKEPWVDKDIPTDPGGFATPADNRALKYFGFLRRDPEEPWFRLMAQIGADGEKPFAIGKKENTKHTIHAYHSGRLYLFVNDVLGCYHNNKGTAEITVRFVKTEN